MITAEHSGSESQLTFSLYPAIGTHNEEEHRLNAPSAAIIFKVCMTLAEKVNGQVFQNSLVGLCHTANGGSTKRIAFYPGEPLRFENVCLRFQEVLLNGISQIGGERDVGQTVD